jgi:hypothetical protein
MDTEWAESRSFHPIESSTVRASQPQPSTINRIALEWIFRSIYDVARFSSVALTKLMHTVKTSFATIERNEGMAIEAAAVLASPLSVVTMGTFPLSLIAFGWVRRQKSDNSESGRAC